MPKSYTKTTFKYEDDILSGKKPACKLVRLACERNRKDIEKSTKKIYKYKYDADKGSKVCRFLEQFVEIKGPRAGKNLKLSDWQVWIIMTVFSWVKKKENTRRFRTATCFVPRGNGKTTIAAPLGLYMLAGDGEKGSEVYSAATTRDQANLSFTTAQHMARRSEGFISTCGIEVGAHNISQVSTASNFIALSADARSLDGLNVHFAVLDELAAHKTRNVYDVILTATGKRSQSLVMAITTSSAWLDGIGYEQYQYIKKILEGGIEDDSYFGVFYSIDDEDAPWDESSWIKANPNWGISVFPDMITSLAKRAMQVPSQQNAFLQKHLNVWTNADVAWMDMRALTRCIDSALKIEDFYGKECVIGLDLASKVDIAAKILLFEENGHYYFFGTYYLPEDAIYESRHSQYQGWARAGNITTTPGNITDFDYIENDIIDDNEKLKILEVAYDPFQATQLVTRLSNRRIPMVEIRPTVLNFSEPMKELEALVLSSRFHFNGDAVFVWMMSNVVCHLDKKDNIYPTKDRPENKIDGVVACIMALSRLKAIRFDFSTYEGNDLITL